MKMLSDAMPSFCERDVSSKLLSVLEAWGRTLVLGRKLVHLFNAARAPAELATRHLK